MLHFKISPTDGQTIVHESTCTNAVARQGASQLPISKEKNCSCKQFKQVWQRFWSGAQTLCSTSAAMRSATRGRWREEGCAAVAGAATSDPVSGAHAGSSSPAKSAAAHQRHPPLRTHRTTFALQNFL